MEPAVALPVLRMLADGIDPNSHIEFPSNSPFQSASVARALHAAVQALESRIKTRNRTRLLPPNAGKAWGENEDQQLVDELYEAIDFAEMAKIHERTRGSIVARLERLGKLNPLSDDNKRVK